VQSLVKVYLYYNTEPSGVPGPYIGNVHIYDGPKKVVSFDDLVLFGDHGSKQDAQNSWAIKPLTINHGLGISVGVQFVQSTPKMPAQLEILFTTAGAEFQNP